MTNRRAACALGVAGLLASTRAAAQASTDWSNLDLANFGEGAVRAGELDVHLGLSALGGTLTIKTECPDLGPGCGTATPPMPYRTKITFFAANLPLDVAYGIGRSLAFEVKLPLNIDASRPSFSTLDGKPLPFHDDIHHHPEKSVTLGDPWLLLRTAKTVGHFTSTARIGVTLPFGETSPNPYVLAAQGLWHEHGQSGSGTLEPIIGLGATYQLTRVSFDAHAVAIFSAYENQWGYREPSRLVPAIRMTVPLFSRVFQPYVALDLPVSTAEHWSILPPGFHDSRAHATVLAGTGFFWALRKPFFWDFNARLRLANIGPGPSYPGTLSVGIGARFDGSSAPPKGPPEPMHQY